MRQERVTVGPGVTIYRRYRKWWVDVRRSGFRAKWNLRTEDKTEALKMGLDVLADSRSNGSPVETLEKAFERYMVEHSTLHHRPNTARRYRQVIGVFLDRVGRSLRPAEVKRRHIIVFQQERAKSVSPSTVNGEITHLRAFFNWCRAEELLGHDPCLKIPRIKVNKSRRRVMTSEEFIELAKALEGHQYWYDFVVFSGNTGMRPDETLHVRGCDLDAAKRLLHITAWGDWQTKPAEDRTIELNAEAFEVLTRRKIANGNDSLPLFAGKGGVVRDVRNVYHRLKEKQPGWLKWIDLYGFRHFFATEAVNRGWPLEKLHFYLGHTDISTTRKYYLHVKAEHIGPPPSMLAGMPKPSQSSEVLRSSRAEK